MLKKSATHNNPNVLWRTLNQLCWGKKFLEIYYVTFLLKSLSLCRRPYIKWTYHHHLLKEERKKEKKDTHTSSQKAKEEKTNPLLRVLATWEGLQHKTAYLGRQNKWDIKLPIQRFEFETWCSDTISKYHLSQKSSIYELWLIMYINT